MLKNDLCILLEIHERNCFHKRTIIKGMKFRKFGHRTGGVNKYLDAPRDMYIYLIANFIND